MKVFKITAEPTETNAVIVILSTLPKVCKTNSISIFDLYCLVEQIYTRVKQDLKIKNEYQRAKAKTTPYYLMSVVKKILISKPEAPTN